MLEGVEVLDVVKEGFFVADVLVMFDMVVENKFF